MSPSAPVFVHLLPSLIPPGTLSGGVAIVVDVLRATTAMIHALDAGCRAIIPCLEVADAKEAASKLPAGSVVLAGERQGIPLPGFDFGNSPGSFTPSVCRDRTVVMTTTNGTRAILASLEAERVLIAAFVNFSRSLREVARASGPVHIVASGTDGRVSLEDSLLAGYFVRALREHGREPGNDSAHLMQLAALRAEREARSTPGAEGGLFSVISRGRGGHRVRELGFVDDIHEASSLDRFDLLAELRREPFGIVRV